MTHCDILLVSLYSDTGWRRLIGSPKLQIIFHKRATRYRALLLKMTSKDKGSYESLPPCTRSFQNPARTRAVYLDESICVHDIFSFVYRDSFKCVQSPTRMNMFKNMSQSTRGGGLGSRPKNMYGETLGDGVEYHLMKPMPRR